ncbi:MAG: hypothetical protein ABSB42_14095 [Tepidisphaeraceae bacterium]|jgi:hypothetical protein
MIRSWRTYALIATALFLFGYPIYVYTDALITGGITRRGDLLVVDLKALSSFEMDQDTGTTQDIPLRYRQLDGKRVLLVGQMWDPYVADGQIRIFTLVYSISNCCFNGPPKIQHFIQATVPPGQAVEYSSDFVDVVGTLHVGVESAAGHVQSVYRIDVENVKRD